MSDRRCRCHSRRAARRCCAPLHAGKPAPSPAALVRSRYAAYALGLVDYIIATTDPDGPQWVADAEAWRDQIRRFAQGTRFRGLTILDAPDAGPHDGFVTFRAELERDGADVSFSERSRFARRDGRWCYHSGEPVR